MARASRGRRDSTGVLPRGQPHAACVVPALHVDLVGVGSRRVSHQSGAGGADVNVADVGARATSGALWTYASYATGRLMAFAGVTLVARLLRPDEYGLFGMASIGINVLEGTYDFGLRRGLIYLVSPARLSAVLRTAFAITLGLGLLLTALLFSLAPFAATFYGEPRVVDLMRLLCVYFGIACLGVVPDALLQHRLAFDRRFWPSIVAPAGRYLVAVPLAALGYGAWSLAWGQLLGISLEVALL